MSERIQVIAAAKRIAEMLTAVQTVGHEISIMGGICI